MAREPMTNSKALEQTLAVLKKHRHFDKIDAAKLQAVRSMAQALDSPMNAANAQLWKVYNEALRDLLANDDGDETLRELLDTMRAGPRNTTPT